jgi:hypothetical protein
MISPEKTFGSQVPAPGVESESRKHPQACGRKTRKGAASQCERAYLEGTFRLQMTY